MNNENVIDLQKLTYEELRMPMDDMDKRNKEIERRVKEKHMNKPIGIECRLCGFEPTSLTEAANHMMVNHPEEYRKTIFKES